jgi:hypothetical protein
MNNKMQAGVYYIGDPCYVLSEADYEEFCNSSFAEPVFEFKGMKCFCEGTHSGDGEYKAKDIRFPDEVPLAKIWVDSGQIAVMPYHLVDESKLGSATLNEGYYASTFWEEFGVETTTSNNHKYFRVGHIKIKT